MRRFAVVVFAVVASILVVSAPVGAATSTEVVSIHDDDTDFNAATTLENVTVEGSGTDAKVALTSITETIDDFEDGDISEYTGDTGLFSAQQSVVIEGAWTLEGEETDGGGEIHSTSGLDAYPEAGDTIVVKLRADGTDSRAQFLFGVQASTSNRYEVEISPSNDQLKLGKDQSIQDTVTGSLSLGTAYDVTVEWGAGGTITATVTDDTATELSVSISDTSYTDGGVGWVVGRETFVSPTMYGDAAIRTGGVETGTYVGQAHDVEDPQGGFTNLTLSNAEATVTWQENTGGTWSDIRTDTYTTSGNKSVDISSATDDEIRVNVTFSATSGETTAELHDEGVEATVHEPEFDNSTASPDDETLTTASPTLEIQLNDSDFPLAHGDSVTVEFHSNKSGLMGSDSLTSNGTASIEGDFSAGGDVHWWAEATDSYGLTNRSANFTVTVPSEIEIREESPDHPLIDTGTVEIMFFEQEDDLPTIVNRSVNDGSVSLEGLPIGSTFVMTAKIDGYYNRTIIVEGIFETDTIFLINESVEARQVTFTIDDDTGVFTSSDTEIYIQHAINESLYASGGFSWLDVAGEETGALDSITVWMAWEERYRIKVRAEGDTRILGAFTPVVNETITLRPATPDINVTDEEGYAWNVTAPEDGSEVVFEFNDPDDNTTDLRLRIYEQGNESNEIYDQTHAGPHGYLKVTQPLTGDQVNQTWTVDWNATRQGSTIGGERTAGRQVIDQIPQLDTVWQHAIAVLAVILTGALFSARNVETGAMTTAFVGGGFWMAGWLPTAAGGAITVAIFIVLAYKVSTRRVT